jgi:hypothetical protein
MKQIWTVERWDDESKAWKVFGVLSTQKDIFKFEVALSRRGLHLYQSRGEAEGFNKSDTIHWIGKKHIYPTEWVNTVGAMVRQIVGMPETLATLALDDYEKHQKKVRENV